MRHHSKGFQVALFLFMATLAGTAFGQKHFSPNEDTAEGRRNLCLNNQKSIESLICLWEPKNHELASGTNKFADIDPFGVMTFDHEKIDLTTLFRTKGIYICPEAKRLFGDNYNKPCYRFFNYDNSGDWIRGSSAKLCGRGVVCIFEMEGRFIGKIGERGPDGTPNTAHNN